ncbi:hypothetical protein PPERSA_00925 [Pseudocohnilembus persalinus]|uniref:Uncharacterized protein n=1 Tax=Pseudocohnilembus persalinus TaxID=266149 RepID=A0A0V0QEQ5_PSEPJ|nr:hypothetical protein PPERSA_00925 [Pseudocohnilembus persalinus]|eukprot:KRX00698.1 hypothetical protein PPERSA_00925 [Pseudocohnilembus persalinus]
MSTFVIKYSNPYKKKEAYDYLKFHIVPNDWNFFSIIYMKKHPNHSQSHTQNGRFFISVNSDYKAGKLDFSEYMNNFSKIDYIQISDPNPKYSLQGCLSSFLIIKEKIDLDKFKAIYNYYLMGLLNRLQMIFSYRYQINIQNLSMAKISMSDFDNALEQFKHKQEYNIFDKFLDRQQEFINHTIELDGGQYLEYTNFPQIMMQIGNIDIFLFIIEDMKSFYIKIENENKILKQTAEQLALNLNQNYLVDEKKFRDLIIKQIANCFQILGLICKQSKLEKSNMKKLWRKYLEDLDQDKFQQKSEKTSIDNYYSYIIQLVDSTQAYTKDIKNFLNNKFGFLIISYYAKKLLNEISIKTWGVQEVFESLLCLSESVIPWKEKEHFLNQETHKANLLENLDYQIKQKHTNFNNIFQQEEESYVV